MRPFIEHTLSGAAIGVVVCFVIVNATITETALNTNTEYFARLIALKVGVAIGGLGGMIYSLCGNNSPTLFKSASGSSEVDTYSLLSSRPHALAGVAYKDIS